MNIAKPSIHAFLGLFILLTICCTPAFSGSKELTLAVGLALPPYNIPETRSGMEFEIVKEALKISGYTVKPKYVPQARRHRELMDRQVDGVLTINPDSGISAFYSDEHITYQNVVVSLKKNNFAIKGVLDLADKSVVAFQRPVAQMILGT